MTIQNSNRLHLTRRLLTGVNWSPRIINRFRELGHFGQSLDMILSQAARAFSAIVSSSAGDRRLHRHHYRLAKAVLADLLAERQAAEQGTCDAVER